MTWFPMHCQKWPASTTNVQCPKAKQKLNRKKALLTSLLVSGPHQQYLGLTEESVSTQGITPGRLEGYECTGDGAIHNIKSK